jgi:hypothetical protein
LVILTGETELELGKLVKFLIQIEAVMMFDTPSKFAFASAQKRWKLTPRLYKLYKEIFDASDSEAS